MRIRVKGLFYLCTVFLLISCGQESGESAYRNLFRMNLSKGCRTLDPAYVRDQAETWMTSQLFDGLVQLNEDLDIKPAIADRWEISDSGKLYTFWLRQDVNFNVDTSLGPVSGRKVLANDVLFSFTRICDPKTASPGAWIFNGKVYGLSEWQKGGADSIAGFSILNDSVFQIRLNEAFAPFMSTLCMPYGYIVQKEAVEKYGKDFRSHPVGTGPFKMKNWKEGSTLNLLKNEEYFERMDGQRLPFLDGIQVKFIESELSAFIEFTQGRLDFINNLDASFRDEVMEVGGKIKQAYADKYQFISIPQLNTEYIAILSDIENALVVESPLRDKRVRQALNYAIDRDKLVRYLLNGNGSAATGGIVPTGSPGFSEGAIRGYSYDPQKASALLAEAGYPGGKYMRPISLKITPTYQAVMEFVQKEWENIGVKTEIDAMQGGALRDQASRGEVLLWRAGWIADYPDAENYLSLFYSPNIPPAGPNRCRFINQSFDKLYRRAITEPEDSSRREIYRQMDQLMIDEAPIIPLYYDRVLRIIQKNISGMKTNSMNHLYLKSLKKL